MFLSSLLLESERFRGTRDFAMQELLSASEALQGLERVAKDIVSRAGDVESLALVGIRRGGVGLAEHLAASIKALSGVEVPLGTVDITLYRDDAPTALPNPRIGQSDVAFDVSSRTIVMVDDVLYTGRTVRAALHAMLDYGRPKAILLFVLVDRGGRELPIQPDFVVKKIQVEPPDHVEVLQENGSFRAVMVKGN